MNFKSFNELADYLDSVPCINQGGCGVSAFFIYEFFKGQGKEAKIVFWHSACDKYFKKNDAAVKGKGNPVAPGHALVEVDGVYYDSCGKHDKEYMEDWGFDQELEVSEKFLLKALKAKNWNDSFDRDQEVPEMEKKIGINLPVK